MRKQLAIFIIFIPFFVIAKNYTICNIEKQPIDSTMIICYNSQMDSIASHITDFSGLVTINNPLITNLIVEHQNYSSQLINIADYNSDTIFLDKIEELKEITVTADIAQNFLTHDTYRISPTAMEKYPNLLLALNEIPNLIVLPSGGVFFEGNSNVKILLNGVETSTQELQTISKDDISKINVYHTPPVRFASQGISSVINVITKSTLHGGNVGLNIKQSFYPLFGDNSAAFYYNYKRSRFSLIFNNSNRDMNEGKQDTEISYHFDGVDYKKIKTGESSDVNINGNNLVLSFQNNLQNSYLYNLKVGVSYDVNNKTNWQNVNSDAKTFDAENILDTKSNSFFINNYFEKHFGEKSQFGNLITNVYYQRINSSFFSNYIEFGNESPIKPSVNVLSDYNTNLDVISGLIQYQLPYKKWGQLSFSISDTFKYSKYMEENNLSSYNNNSFNSNVMYILGKNHFTYILRGGISGNYIFSNLRTDNFKQWSPTAMAGIYYNLNKNIRFRLSYNFALGMPTMAQLSETKQWIDTKLVFHGNALLIPSKNHLLTFSTIGKSKYIDATFSANFNSTPNMICNHYTETSDYILESIINLKKYISYGGSLDFTIKPLGNNKWTIYSNLYADKKYGEGINYNWEGYTFRWAIGSSLYLKKWYFNAYYQYPGKNIVGQLISPRAECWNISFNYRPINDMSIGIDWFMPFGKNFIESEQTVDTAPVFVKTINKSKDRVNMLSLKFSWNFSFGKNQNKAKPNFSGENEDNGILKK